MLAAACASSVARTESVSASGEFGGFSHGLGRTLIAPSDMKGWFPASDVTPAPESGCGCHGCPRRLVVSLVAGCFGGPPSDLGGVQLDFSRVPAGFPGRDGGCPCHRKLVAPASRSCSAPSRSALAPSRRCRRRQTRRGMDGSRKAALHRRLGGWSLRVSARCQPRRSSGESAARGAAWWSSYWLIEFARLKGASSRRSRGVSQSRGL